jgi:hypothetical protein
MAVPTEGSKGQPFYVGRKMFSKPELFTYCF